MIKVLHTGIREAQKVEGIQFFHAPALCTEMVKIHTKRGEGIGEDITGIFFFSPRAVQSVFSQGIKLPESEYYVVGSQTAHRLNALYHRQSTVFQTFAKLRESYVETRNELSFELLDGPRSMKNVSKKIQVIPCYETTYASLPVQKIYEFDSDWVVFTSPKGVQSFCKQVDYYKLNALAATIGETTYRELKEIHNINAEFENSGSIRVEEIFRRIKESI